LNEKGAHFCVDECAQTFISRDHTDSRKKLLSICNTEFT